MFGDGGWSGRIGKRHGIESLLKDRFHGAVAVGATGKRVGARGFEPFLAVRAPEADQPEATAVSEGGVGHG